ncbi:MAG: HD domain-containing protein [Desulfobacteraceae bacterium]|nr:HD domain-containing protein [Desulfobacteraceae bacterium]
MKTKAILEFLKEIEKFKTCERSCHTSDPNRAESDAEHSWHLALFLILFEKELGTADLLKMLKLALIHDLPEIYAGDTNPYRGDMTDKAENEKQAADKLFSLLPEELKNEFTDLFNEYINQETKESQIVKSADKLMPLIQNICTTASFSSYRNLEVTYSEVEKYMDSFFLKNDLLKDIYRKLLKEADMKNVFSGDKEKEQS